MPANEENPSAPTDGSELQHRMERRRARREERLRQRSEDPPPGEPVAKRRSRASARPRSNPPPPERSSPERGRRRSGPSPELTPYEFPPGSIDEAAEKVVRRLTRAGHEAYLVGGCVRDLLVGKRPKDFDVATSARPEEVRALLRNSRIIGRRFRLVHVLFPAGHVIETATFRRNPPQTGSVEGDDLLIRSDNHFGQAHEDAQRRDFTINGLFYDLDRRAVLDWVGGMHDIAAKRVSTIGDPIVRFQEDPVRMLRAIKFAARLDFGIEPEVYHAAVQCRGSLAMAARPRLSEEILRLMRGGAAHRSVWLMWEMGMLDILLPELSGYLADAESDALVWHILREVDRRTELEATPLDDTLLWAALLSEPLLEACESAPDRLRAARDFLEPVVERLNLPRRIADSLQRIFAMLPKIHQGKAARFKRSTLFPLAEMVLELRGTAEALGAPTSGFPEPFTKQRPPGRRRRKRKPDGES